MAKQPAKINHLHDDRDIEDRLTKLETDKAIADGINKWRRAICISTTSVFLSGVYWFGGFIYANYSAVETGVKAFIIAMRGGRD